MIRKDMLTNDEIDDDPIKRVEAYTAETSLTDFLPRLPSEELNEFKIDFLAAHLDKNRLTLEGMFPKKMSVNTLDNQKHILQLSPRAYRTTFGRSSL